MLPQSYSSPKGQFLWSQATEYKKAGAEMLYVMFDEVDEATAIMKCTNNPPIEKEFSDYEGLPSDHYLKLAEHKTQIPTLILNKKSLIFIPIK